MKNNPILIEQKRKFYPRKQPTSTLKILKKIAINNNQSNQSLQKTLGLSQPRIAEKIIELANDHHHYIQKANRPLTADKTERAQNYYGLTEKGIEFLIQCNYLSPEEFCQMFINVSDTNFQYFIEDKEPKWINSNLDLNKIINLYEKYYFNFSRKHFSSDTTRLILNSFLYPTEKLEKFFTRISPILLKLAIDGKLTFQKINEFNKIKKNTLLEMNQLGLVFLWKEEEKWSITQFGLLLLFKQITYKIISFEKEFALYMKHIIDVPSKKDKKILKDIFKSDKNLYKLMYKSRNKQEKELISLINKIVEKNYLLLPEIFSESRWQLLKSEINELELVLTLIHFYFQRRRFPTIYDNADALVLLQSQKTMEIFYRNKMETEWFYFINFIKTFWITEHIFDVHPIEKNGFLSYKFLELSTKSDDELRQQELKKWKKLGIKRYPFRDEVFDESLAKFRQIIPLFREVIKIEQILGRRNVHSFEFEFCSQKDFEKNPLQESLRNVMAFRFFVYLRNNFSKEIKKIAKGDIKLKNWYKVWVEECRDFNRKNMELFEVIGWIDCYLWQSF